MCKLQKKEEEVSMCIHCSSLKSCIAFRVNPMNFKAQVELSLQFLSTVYFVLNERIKFKVSICTKFLCKYEKVFTQCGKAFTQCGKVFTQCGKVFTQCGKFSRNAEKRLRNAEKRLRNAGKFLRDCKTFLSYKF